MEKKYQKVGEKNLWEKMGPFKWEVCPFAFPKSYLNETSRFIKNEALLCATHFDQTIKSNLLIKLLKAAMSLFICDFYFLQSEAAQEASDLLMRNESLL